MQIFGMTGEALGEIGASATTKHPSESESSRDPEWKRYLAHTPSVSVRRGYVVGPSLATEPTSTLVLTSLHSHFVDIRFSLVPPATTGPHFWAFAGTSTTEFPNYPTKREEPGHSSTGGGDPGPFVTFPSAQCTWTRSVDSKGDLETPDRGTCFWLRGGEVLEVGMMGDGVMYQELWGQVGQVDVGRLLGGVGEEVDGEMLNALDQGRDMVSVVALLKGEEGKINGVMVRVGPFCQGIVALPGGGEGKRLVCVERWAFVRDGKGGIDGNGIWVRDPRSDFDDDARSKGVVLPCGWVQDQGRTGRRSVGEVLGAECYGGRWTVVEAEYPR